MRCLAVVSDRALLERIVSNLVANAIQHTDTDRVLVGARPRGERVRADVLDTGPRIPSAQAQELFEDFRHGKASRSGFGLGLGIVRRLSSLLGHEVEVTSKLGRGSRFSILVRRASTRE